MKNSAGVDEYISIFFFRSPHFEISADAMYSNKYKKPWPKLNRTCVGTLKTEFTDTGFIDVPVKNINLVEESNATCFNGRLQMSLNN